MASVMHSAYDHEVTGACGHEVRVFIPPHGIRGPGLKGQQNIAKGQSSLCHDCKMATKAYDRDANGYVGSDNHEEHIEQQRTEVLENMRGVEE